MTDDPRSNLTADQIKIIVTGSVRDTLTSLGIDLSDTKALQSVQADFVFMRKQRQSSEKLADWIRHSAVVVLIGGVFTIVWYGVRAALLIKGGGP